MPKVTQPGVTERSGSSTTGRTPNIRYFVAKLSIVAIYDFPNQTEEEKLNKVYV